MSWELETKNRGWVEGLGFNSPDIWVVDLGEMPLISLGQFCTYSSETAAGYAASLAQPELEIVRRYLAWARNFTAGKKVRDTDNPLEMPPQIPVKSRLTPVSPDITLGQVQVPVEWVEKLQTARSAGDERAVDRLWEQLTVNMRAGSNRVARHYPENPFAWDRGLHQIDMGSVYAVEPARFAHFAIHIMQGGYAGWDSLGIPKPAHTGLQNLYYHYSPED